MQLPVTKSCVYALHLDPRRKTEHVMIGEREQVIQYLQGNEKASLLSNAARPFGSFIADCSAPMVRELADLRAALTDSTGRKKSPAFTSAIALLEKLYASPNLTHRYIALKAWQEYHCACQNKQADLYTALSDIMLPAMYNLKQDIFAWQSTTPRNPLQQLPREFSVHTATVQFSAGPELDEYLLAEGSLLPLVVYYLKNTYTQKQYIRECKQCGRLFQSPSAGRASLCSDVCRKAQQKANKQSHSQRAKQNPAAIQYNNTCAYWYYRTEKIQETFGDESPQLQRAKAAFADFRAQAKARKKALYKNEITDTDFATWLLQQRDRIDALIEPLAID